MSRWGQVAVGLLGLWGLVLSVGLGMGWLVPAPEASYPAEDGAAPAAIATATRPVGASPVPASDTPAGSEPAEAEADQEPASNESVDGEPRFRVCDRSSGPPRLSVLPSGLDAPARATGDAAWLAVHCGGSIHLLAFDSTSQPASLRRIVRLTTRAELEGALAGPVHMASITPHGDASLLLPLRRARPDRQLQDGRLYAMTRNASGGFDAPRVLAPVGPSALQQIPERAGLPARLALLVPHPQTVPVPSEVWSLDLGKQPEPARRWKVASGAEHFVWVDVDGDGMDDLVTAGSQSALEWRRGTPEQAWQEPVRFAEVPGAQELTLADVTGDGREEVLVAGEALWVLSADPEPVLEQLSDQPLRDVRWVSALPALSGAPAIVGYAHPRLIALRPGEPGEAGTRVLSELRIAPGEAEVAVAQTLLGDVTGDGETELVVLTRDEPGGAVALSMVRRPLDHPQLVLAATAEPLPAAPLALEVTLP